MNRMESAVRILDYDKGIRIMKFSPERTEVRIILVLARALGVRRC